MANTTKEQRLETRCTADQKALIVRAAALSGRSVTDFANSTLVEAATRIIREHEAARKRHGAAGWCCIVPTFDKLHITPLQ